MKNQEIPKKIHFIWLGGAIPENYLDSILSLAKIAKNSGFELNLWVDNKDNYYKTINHKIHYLNIEIPKPSVMGIKLRKINEIFGEISEHPLFTGEDEDFLLQEFETNRIKLFCHCVNREMIGFKNLAASADFLRLAILLLKGGYYFDTDTQFEFDTNIIYTNSFDFGFSANIPKNNNELYVSEIIGGFGNCGNDIIAILPNHKLMKMALIHAMYKYEKYDNKIENGLTYMDWKRFPIEQKIGYYRGHRTELTIAASGPLAFSFAAMRYVKETIQSEEESLNCQLRLENINYENSKLFESRADKKSKIKIISNSHQTWIYPNISRKNINPFDDSCLIEDKYTFSVPSEFSINRIKKFKI